MTGALPHGIKRATVPGARDTGLPTPPVPGGDPTDGGGRRQLSPAELHAWRVEWGKWWGARIREATERWKGEL